MSRTEIKLTPSFFKEKKVTKTFAEEVKKTLLKVDKRNLGWLFIYQTFDNKWGHEYRTDLHKNSFNRVNENMKYKFYAPIKEAELSRAVDFVKDSKLRGTDNEKVINYIQKMIQENTGGVWNLTRDISEKNLKTLITYEKYLDKPFNQFTESDMPMGGKDTPMVQVIYVNLMRTYDKKTKF